MNQFRLTSTAAAVVASLCAVPDQACAQPQPTQTRPHHARHKAARRPAAARPVPASAPVAPSALGPSINGPATIQPPVIQVPQRQAPVEATRPQKDLRDAAASKTTITSDALLSSNSQTTQDALRDVPGVASTDTRGSGTGDSLQIRGIKLSATTSYRLDGGLPIVNNILLALEDKQRVEALKGAGALQFGLASPAGIVNFVMKRATAKPIAALSTTVNSTGQVIGAVDVGRRFGPEDQFGVRVNLAGGEIGSYVNNAGGTRAIGAIALDWRPSARTSIIFDYERFAINVIEQAAILLNPAVRGRIALPGVPDPTKLRSGDWARSRGTGENIFSRANVDLGRGFEVVGEVGRSFGYRPERNVAQIGNYNIVTGLGRGNATLIQKQLTENYAANLEGHYTYGWDWATNLVAVGIARNERDFNNPSNPTYSFAQNIYAPFGIPAPSSPNTRNFFPNNSHDTDYFFRDQIDLFSRVHMFAGVRRIIYESDNTAPTGKRTFNTTRFDAPGFGAVIDVTPTISVYLDAVKSLEESGQAPVNSANAYSVLPPAPARQKEVGLRLTRPDSITTSLGYFKITRANATTDPVTNIYALNGSIEYEGAEYTILVPGPRGLLFNAGGQYMHAVQASRDQTIDQKAPENTPLWSGTVGVTYRPPPVPGLSFNAGMQYVGPREANPQNQAKLPGFAVFNAGVSYATVIQGHRTSFNLTGINLANHRYFSSVANGALGLGTPLTVAFSLRTEL